MVNQAADFLKSIPVYRIGKSHCGHIYVHGHRNYVGISWIRKYRKPWFCFQGIKPFSDEGSILRRSNAE
jgi:hypothetical protein